MKQFLMVILVAAVMVSVIGVSPVAAGAAPCAGTYTVQRGDYLSKIARMCEVSLAALINANPDIKNWNIIYVGQVLVIPDGTQPTPEPGGATYIVQPGDTLRKIASRFSVTVDAILKLNPNITNASLIYAGQRIKLPKDAARVPTVSVAPARGKAGSQVTLAASGFRANIDVDVLFGQTNAMESIGRLKTDGSGAIFQEVSVPASAQNGKSYVFEVRSTQNNSERAISNTFTVDTGGTSGGQTYIVQRGDTLRIIAARFGTSVAAILAVNPNISNPNIIYVGQRITLPGGSATQPVVTITPASGVPGSQINVVVGGFPANQDVDIKLGIKDGAVKLIVDSRTDASGYINKSITLPASAVAGEKWVVRVHTTELQNGVSAISNTFTVK